MPSPTPRRPRTVHRLTWTGQDLPVEAAEQLLGPGGPFELMMEDRDGFALRVFTHRPSSVVEVLIVGPTDIGTVRISSFPNAR